MTKKALRSVVALACAAILSATKVHAQDNNLARTYHVIPKAGMAAQFEAAMAAHAQWRMDNGDPWAWGISTYDTGEDLGSYGIRSSGHTWADFDAYDSGFGPKGLLHWQATVQPLVESLTSTITATNNAISKPNPAGRQLALVTVTKFHLRPGQEQRFQQLVTQAMNIVKDKLPGYWVWTSPVSGGGPGPFTTLVGLYSNWGGMHEPDPTFASIMIREMGQNDFEKWMSDVGETYRGVEVWTQRLRPDLGVTAAN